MFSFLKRANVDPKAKLAKVLRGYSLPSFPGAVMETLQRIRNPESSASSIAEVLAVDPGLSVRVLRVANSAAFSPTKRVENLTQAVALVGLSQLESLVLSVAAASAVPRESCAGYDFNRFWRAAARRGVIARAFARILCPARESESFTAGLLQDLAIPFLAHTHPDKYGPVLARWHEGDEDLVKLERETFDWDHAEVGTWICSEWALPENIASAIGGHHGDPECRYDCPPPVALVASIRENGNQSGVETLVETAHSPHGVPPEKTRELIESSLRSAEELARLML
jgi:HD-like signal output (HDOD) protein